MRVDGVGLRLRQAQLLHVLPYIPGDKLDSRLHFGHDPRGFRDPLQTRLTETFLLGNGTNAIDLGMDIPGNQLAIAPHAALQVDKVIRLADSTDTVDDLLTLGAEALVLVACGVHLLLAE